MLGFAAAKEMEAAKRSSLPDIWGREGEIGLAAGIPILGALAAATG